MFQFILWRSHRILGDFLGDFSPVFLPITWNQLLRKVVHESDVVLLGSRPVPSDSVFSMTLPLCCKMRLITYISWGFGSLLFDRISYGVNVYCFHDLVVSWPSPGIDLWAWLTRLIEAVLWILSSPITICLVQISILSTDPLHPAEARRRQISSRSWESERRMFRISCS